MTQRIAVVVFVESDEENFSDAAFLAERAVKNAIRAARPVGKAFGYVTTTLPDGRVKLVKVAGVRELNNAMGHSLMCAPTSHVFESDCRVEGL